MPEGSVIYTPAGTPHSPRFAPDAYLLVVERKRREGEVDRFQWFCPKCDELLHEVQAVVDDYKNDPVSKAYQQFFDSEAARTCKKLRQRDAEAVRRARAILFDHLVGTGEQGWRHGHSDHPSQSSD